MTRAVIVSNLWEKTYFNAIHIMIKILSALSTLLLFLFIFYFRSSVVPNTLESNKQLIDFKTLKVPSTPNFYLSCPKGLCHHASLNSPIFACSIETLETKWQQVSKRNHLTLLTKERNEHLARFYALSSLFHFPDLIDVQFYPISEESATLSLYSHAVFGYSDFGVNKRRVLTLLNELKNECK